MTFAMNQRRILRTVLNTMLLIVCILGVVFQGFLLYNVNQVGGEVLHFVFLSIVPVIVYGSGKMLVVGDGD